MGSFTYATGKDGITHIVDRDAPGACYGPIVTACGLRLNPLTTITKQWKKKDAKLCEACKQRFQNYVL